MSSMRSGTKMAVADCQLPQTMAMGQHDLHLGLKQQHHAYGKDHKRHPNTLASTAVYRRKCNGSKGLGTWE